MSWWWCSEHLAEIFGASFFLPCFSCALTTTTTTPHCRVVDIAILHDLHSASTTRHRHLVTNSFVCLQQTTLGQTTKTIHICEHYTIIYEFCCYSLRNPDSGRENVWSTNFIQTCSLYVNTLCKRSRNNVIEKRINKTSNKKDNDKETKLKSTHSSNVMANKSILLVQRFQPATVFNPEMNSNSLYTACSYQTHARLNGHLPPPPKSIMIWFSTLSTKMLDGFTSPHMIPVAWRTRNVNVSWYFHSFFCPLIVIFS